MANDSKPKRLPDFPGATVSFTFDDKTIQASANDSVAAALLAAGERVTRTTPISGSPRAAYCMMGVCFECLMEIDGVANSQACMTRVAQDIVVRRMQGARHVLPSQRPHDSAGND